MSKSIKPTERHIERLAIIRHQISYAQEQVRQPSPIHQLALNTMQDFVESSLHVVAESHKITVNGNAFDNLLENVTKKFPGTELSGYTVLMKSMNKARVNFKHHGNSSDIREVTAHLTESIEFVRELAKEAYGIDLDSISIVAFIQNEKVKQHLKESEKQWQAGDEKAMFNMRIAFDELIHDYTHRKLWSPGTTIFNTKPSFMPNTSDLRYLGMDKIYDWIENIDSWVKYIALGIDMRRFAFFDAHTPNVAYSMNRTPHGNFRNGVEVNEDTYQKCRRFVIDTALALMQDDFDFDPWNNRKFD